MVIGNDKSCILAVTNNVLEGCVASGRVPDKWDGKAAERIVNWLLGNAIALKPEA